MSSVVELLTPTLPLLFFLFRVNPIEAMSCLCASSCPPLFYSQYICPKRVRHVCRFLFFFVLSSWQVVVCCFCCSSLYCAAHKKNNPRAHTHTHRGLLYTAALGEGTFVRALSAGADDSRRVFVDHARKPGDTRVLESVEAGHTSHAVAAQVCSDLGITLPPIRVDGQAKYGLLSEGQV